MYFSSNTKFVIDFFGIFVQLNPILSDTDYNYFLIIVFMAANVFITSDANFERDISAGVVLVDFWAEWCGPCQVMIPRLGELATKMGDSVKIMKMNVDENPHTAQKFRIMSIPTMIVFKDAKPVEQLVGVKSVEDLSATLKKYIGGTAANDAIFQKAA